MNEAEKKRLWDEYGKTKSPETKEKIIIEYAPLVKVVAGRLSMYLGYNVEYDDLVGYGVFGLIDAIEKYDLCKEVKFETYASLRIRGAILDQIRKMDWIPRTIRQKQKKIETAIREIESREGRPATDEEIASSLGITDEEYLDWHGQMKVTIESGAHSQQFDSPETVIEKEELKRMLMESLEVLTEKEKKVILFYYYEELTLKEISSILEVSESRISQLHTRALQKMKAKMGKYMGILTER